ncbi:hypothetical protein CEUSTIGMA_g1257.t1 [Chlamydomonas eustigma]|uniref:Arp2/3 complex 34 kDa subunit n=1 Tax=Chlamydomonas eustigma TaxID=1157962 RepID=A0A250WST6_9CHLO|nr:hypothetical protein CEUSTIGMA_g1257.t1 [Chlamydomonas eustigma]|eukprot:GAX73806.1 hypothetical protein CEUSTIGMA_g1257.t1 [Chlamydomonas eustigma]
MACTDSCNGLLYNRMKQWVHIPPTIQKQEKLCEWGGVKYLLQHMLDESMKLSVYMPELSSCDDVNKDVETAVLFKGMASVDAQVISGYHITLDVNVRLLRRLPDQQQAFWLRELSSIRCKIMTSSLRKLSHRLIDERKDVEEIVAMKSCSSQTYFVKLQESGMKIIFPMRFPSAQDAAIGRHFLQGFVDAGKQATLKRAPSCSYDQEVPCELQGLDLALIENVNGGYINMFLTVRHLSGPQMNEILWSVCSFYYFVSRRLKACKAKLQDTLSSQFTYISSTLPDGPSEWLQV